MKSVLSNRVGKPGLAMLLIAFGALAFMPESSVAEDKVNKGDAAVAKRSAKLYQQQRLFDKAIEQLLLAVSGDPEDAEAHFMLGQLYSEKSNIEKMIEHFDKVTALPKGKKKFGKDVQQFREMWWQRRYNEAVKALNAQDFTAALEMFRVADQILPGKADTFKGLGVAYLQAGKIQEGIDTYLKAEKLDSTDTGVLVNLGVAYLNQGTKDSSMFKEAVKVLQKAHRIKPKDMTVMERLAMAYQRVGDNQSALQTAEKMLAVDPNNLAILSMSGQLFLVSENYPRAAEVLEKALSVQAQADSNAAGFDKNAASFNLATAYKQMKQYDKAESLFLKSVTADPKDADAWYQLGLIYDYQEKCKDAIQPFQMYVSLKPEDPRGYRALSRTYARYSEKLQGLEATDAARKAEEYFKKADEIQASGAK